MILRTVILLGLGAAQPVGLAIAAGPAGPQAPEAEAQVSAREILARDLASWRVDIITQDEAADVLSSLQSLVARGEALASAEPGDSALVELLTDLYLEEFTQSERRLGFGALRALFVRRLRSAHNPDRSPGAIARARASMAVVTLERIEQLIDHASAPHGGSDADTSTLDDRRRLGPRAQMIASAVEEALAENDIELIHQLGPAAAEPLAAAALRQSGERVRSGELDPLVLLATVDPSAALDIALAHVRAEDLLLKLRVVDAFKVADPFQSESVWVPSSGGAFELSDSAWAEIVVSLYSEPAVPVAQADPFLRTFMGRGYAPLGLPSLLPGCLTRLPLRAGPVRPVAVEAAEELLATDTAAAQRAGLKVLMLSESVAPAWALAASPREDVRELLAKTFGPRLVDRREIRPTVDARYREALRVFLNTESDGGSDRAPGGGPVAVALKAAAQLVPSDKHAPLVGAPTLIYLLKSAPQLSPATLEGALLHLDALEKRERFQVIEAAAQAMLRVLETPQPERGDQWKALWGLYAQPSLQNVLGAAVEAGDGEAFINVFDEGADAGVWRQVIETTRTDSGLTRFSEHIPGLSPALQMKVVRALWRTGYDNFAWLDEDELSLRRDHWLSLAADRQLPRPARIWALEAMANETTSPAPAGAAAQLAEIVADLGECPIASHQLGTMGFDPEDYLNHLLDLPSASDEAVLNVFINLKRESSVARLLERFPPSTWAEHRDATVLSAVISSLVKRRDPVDNKALIAANIPYSPIQSYLIKALLAERFAGHLPLGGAILKSGLMEQSLAIEYVASFMRDDAARYLVEAMETARTESYRNLLFEALQGLTERREVAERWLRSSDAAARHDAAVRKLVAVIESAHSSPSARAEAVKGLGLLDARDELPRLIEMLDGESQSLQVAARAAIDRMSR